MTPMNQAFTEKISLGGIFLLRLLPEEDVFEGLKRICLENGMERAVVLSGIGSLKDVTFRNVQFHVNLPVSLDRTNIFEEEGPFELLSLEGNVFPAEGGGDSIVHLHALLGSPTGALRGGHLIKAAVFSTVEIVLGKIEESTVQKAKSDVTGLQELTKK
jgi:uncharacterized protein